MQGTGAITLAAVLSGVRATKVALKDHRVVVFGAGTAGVGIADQIRDATMLEGLSEAEATSRIWCLASHGLLVEGMAGGMRDFQQSYARKASDVAGFTTDQAGGIPLEEVVQPG